MGSGGEVKCGIRTTPEQQLELFRQTLGSNEQVCPLGKDPRQQFHASGVA
jgi:hypothetical protein